MTRPAGRQIPSLRRASNVIQLPVPFSSEDERRAHEKYMRSRDAAVARGLNAYREFLSATGFSNVDDRTVRMAFQAIKTGYADV